MSNRAWLLMWFIRITLLTLLGLVLGALVGIYYGGSLVNIWNR